VATPRTNIAYAAHTASCSFLLDAEGICRRVVLRATPKRRAGSRTGSRCVGAQYVASLDGSAAGGLVEMPRVGAAMLFARVDERGRVSLVRTSAVTAFESLTGEDPFLESTSDSVQTSAPDLSTPRAAAGARSAAPVDPDGPDLEDPDYHDANEQTQRIHALRPREVAAALGHEHPGRASSAGPVSTKRSPQPLRDQGPPPSRVSGLPAPLPPPVSPPSSRAMPPRRSDPSLRAAARAEAPATLPLPRDFGSDVQLARRRRGP
jgi:hypothetical protein